MVRSILDEAINYPELRKLDDDDREFDASVYESFILGRDVLIALGQPKYPFIENSIVYYPVYLVKDGKVKLQIGVYEVLADRVPNIMDEDGDVELGLLDEPLLYSFVTENLIESAASSSDGPRKDERGSEDGDDETKDSDETKDGDETKDDVDTTKPLPEQTSEEAKLEKSQYKQEAGQPWIQTFMKNNNFGIEDIAGDGDCLFTTIHEGLKSIGRDVPVSEMRRILADHVTEEMYLNYRVIYDNALSESDTSQAEVKFLSKQHRELKKRLGTTPDRDTQQDIIKKASEVGARHAIARRERADAKEMLDEFSFMKGVTGVDLMKEKVQTCEFWGETWAISTLERVLNIKLILFSEEAFKDKDLENVMRCGQLNDSVLEKEGKFEPTHYIMANYQGNHYELITYKNRGALTFNEIPYDVKRMIVNKCLERNAGPYYIIPQFRNFMEELKVVVSEAPIGEIHSDTYDDNTVFQFYLGSGDKPRPGSGSGERMGPEGAKAYAELRQIPSWRKKLSNLWTEAFQLDGHKWQSVEHYYQASKFKRNNPDFYLQFSLDSGSELSKDPLLAKAAGEKSGKYKGKELRPKDVTIDADFFSGRDKTEMEYAIKAKFEQNDDLGRLLKATKKAKLNHFSRGSPPTVSEELMKVRKGLK